MKIILAPYPAKLPSGKLSPKSYPYWPKLVSLLNAEGYEVIQIGVKGEERIEGVGQFITNFPFHKVRDLINDCALWVSVDSWLPHFVHYERLKPGICLFGQSDPRIFGYPENTNLLRGRDYLRRYQFDTWEAAEYNPNAFVFAENVMPHVHRLAPLPVPPELLLTANLHARTQAS